jgi:hypothetical protein
LRNAALVGATAICLSLFSAAPSSAWVIDFEDFGDPGQAYGLQTGWIVDNEYNGSWDSDKASGAPGAIPDSGGITASFTTYRKNGSGYYENGYGALFNTASSTANGDPSPGYSGGDNDLWIYNTPSNAFTNATLGNSTPDHVLIIHEHSGECDQGYAPGRCKDPDDNLNGGKFVIEFSELVWLDSIDFFDIEPGEAGGSIKLYNGATEIMPDTFATPDTGGDNGWDQVAFNGVGIDKIVIKLRGTGAIDNITGQLAQQQVPEPAGLGLLAFGTVAMGAIRRRRKRGDKTTTQ